MDKLVAFNPFTIWDAQNSLYLRLVEVSISIGHVVAERGVLALNTIVIDIEVRAKGVS